MICTHAQPEARKDYAICAISAAGPNHPHKSFCAACKLYDGPPRPVTVTVTPPDAPQSLPRDKWPVWANLLALASTEADTGVGDTVARVVGPWGGEAVKAWFKSHGKDCGCNARQDTFNAKYPYRT